MDEHPFITRSQHELLACDHLVLAFPTWWAAEPSLLKGWLDRVLTPGFAYRYRPDRLKPDRLLTDRAASLITTSHEQTAWTCLAPAAPVARLGRAVLGYYRMRVTQRLVLGSMEGKADTLQRRRAFLDRLEKTGARQAERLRASQRTP